MPEQIRADEKDQPQRESRSRPQPLCLSDRDPPASESATAWAGHPQKPLGWAGGAMMAD